MHRVLKVALQPWPTLVGMKSLFNYTIEYKVGQTYFRADRFCRYQRENIADRRAIRQNALDRASGSSDGQVIPGHECESFIYKRPSPRTLAQLKPDFVAGSSSSLSRSSLSTLLSEDRGVTLRSRFSVEGSEADYPDTVDGDYSDFGDAYGIYRR